MKREVHLAKPRTRRYAWGMIQSTAANHAQLASKLSLLAPTSAVLPIQVAILEDEAHVRALFEQAVRSDSGLHLAFSAQSVAEAKAKAQENAAQVYLVDLGLPDADGREFIRWLHIHQQHACVMVVTVFGDDEHIVSSFAAGAVGYLLKDTPISEIALRIAELHAGGSPISPSVARRMLQHFMPSVNTNAPASIASLEQPLSEREHEVLRLIEKGLTYDEISKVLDITWHTVTGYLRRVYRKLQVNSRSEAVFEARQRGLL
jgi:DNA-binding NarL/FixJ family response regulator